MCVLFLNIPRQLYVAYIWNGKVRVNMSFHNERCGEGAEICAVIFWYWHVNRLMNWRDIVTLENNFKMKGNREKSKKIVLIALLKNDRPIRP